jgi:hypothetical protein
MTGKIVEITPERSKELDAWVIKSLNQLNNIYPKFLELITQKSLVVNDDSFGDYRHALTHTYEPIKDSKITVQILYCVNINEKFIFMIHEDNNGKKSTEHVTDVLFHKAAFKAISKLVDLYTDQFGTKGKNYLIFFKIYEAYRTWVNEHALAIKQFELPGITADLPQSLPVITDELPMVKQYIPDWIKALKPGESVWVGHTDHSKWEFPDGYRMYFELEQFQSLDDDIVLTNKSSCHNSYIYPTDVRFQFLFEGINYISAEPFHYEEFITTIDFLKGGKEVKLSKYTDKKRAHEILTLDLHFKWFELLKNKPKGKVKSKSTPNKELKEVEIENRSAVSVPQWKFSKEEAINLFIKAQGEQIATEVLNPFFMNSKLDEAIPFHFTDEVEMCCTFCDNIIQPNQASWLLNNNSYLFYIYCNNADCGGKDRIKPFNNTSPKTEIETEAKQPNELAAPGNNFRERYNNKKMRNRLIKQLEEMPADRRAYLIESIQQHFTI